MDTSDLTSRGYGAVLWEPDQQTVRDARISHFMRWLEDRHVLYPGSYEDLWRWSVSDPGAFWAAVWSYFDVLGDRGPGPVLTGEVMPDVQWFTGATLNYARNALRTAWTDPGRTAIIFDSERTRAGHLSYAQLAHQVARVARGLRALGVRRGDRVAALLPNVPEAIIGLLATASIGAIWSSCSPDFGARSVIDRFAQIEPTVLIAGDGYWYGGKEFSRAGMVNEVVAALPGLSAVVVVDLIGAADTPSVRFTRWDDLGPESPDSADSAESEHREPEFEEVPFDHPLWVVYSSGTTGLPKPIMHGHGGIVLEHLKALAFHQDLRPGDVFTWYTTTGWMMWNYLAGGLLAGLTIVLYDGSATYPATDRLWRLAAEHGVTYLGVGAPYLVACMKAGLRPGDEADLSALRAIGSTGSPLPPEAFGWVYERVKKDLLLGSFSGGTDLCTGFVGPCPLLPVRAGIISGRCLGAEVEAYDDDGQPVTGQVGELVITQPMPSMPVGFWNDPGGVRYRESYFDTYPGVWRHGDWIELLPDGGCVIYGRSRRHPQPRRGPDGHQRVLPRGGELSRDRRQPGGGHRPARRRGPADPVRHARRGLRAGRRPGRPAARRAPVPAVAPARTGRNPPGTRHPAHPVREETRGASAQDPARRPAGAGRRPQCPGQPGSPPATSDPPAADPPQLL